VIASPASFNGRDAIVSAERRAPADRRRYRVESSANIAAIALLDGKT
jgi:hypothetical protein